MGDRRHYDDDHYSAIITEMTFYHRQTETVTWTPCMLEDPAALQGHYRPTLHPVTGLQQHKAGILIVDIQTTRNDYKQDQRRTIGGKIYRQDS